MGDFLKHIQRIAIFTKVLHRNSDKSYVGNVNQ